MNALTVLLAVVLLAALPCATRLRPLEGGASAAATRTSEVRVKKNVGDKRATRKKPPAVPEAQCKAAESARHALPRGWPPEAAGFTPSEHAVLAGRIVDGEARTSWEPPRFDNAENRAAGCWSSDHDLSRAKDLLNVIVEAIESGDRETIDRFDKALRVLLAAPEPDAASHDRLVHYLDMIDSIIKRAHALEESRISMRAYARASAASAAIDELRSGAAVDEAALEAALEAFHLLSEASGEPPRFLLAQWRAWPIEDKPDEETTLGPLEGLRTKFLHLQRDARKRGRSFFTGQRDWLAEYEPAFAQLEPDRLAEEIGAIALTPPGGRGRGGRGRKSVVGVAATLAVAARAFGLRQRQESERDAVDRAVTALRSAQRYTAAKS